MNLFALVGVVSSWAAVAFAAYQRGRFDESQRELKCMAAEAIASEDPAWLAERFGGGM